MSITPPGERGVAGVALDSRNLDALRIQANKDPRAALRTAAQQFEAVFMSMLLKSMRDTVQPSGLMGGHAGAGNEMATYTGMLDQQLVQTMTSQGRGTGLADMIVRQLSKSMENQPKTNAMSGEFGGQSTLKFSASRSAPQAFVNQHLDAAREAQEKTGVPAEFMLGQAALESGWGRGEIMAANGASSFNLFGIKATSGWKGKVVESVTTEYINGKAEKRVERFRAYDSYAHAFQDYARLISTSPRYAKSVAQASAAGNAAQFSAGLQSGGYATDPRYAEKLTRVINQTIAMARA